MDVGIVKQFKLDISPLGQSPREIFVYLPNDYDNEKDIQSYICLMDKISF